MKMKLVYFAISAVLLGVGPAQASNSTFAGEEHICTTTTKKGGEYVGIGSTQAVADHLAMTKCTASGASPNECRENMMCEINDGGFPVPDQDDQDDQNQGGQQDDQDDQGDQGDQDQGHPNKPHGKMFYNWGRGQNGFGYCYAFDKNGNVLHWGQPQPTFNCERVRPSHFNWGRSWDGFIYCYQFTPYLAVMNEGRPVAPGYCRY